MRLQIVQGRRGERRERKMGCCFPGNIW